VRRERESSAQRSSGTLAGTCEVRQSSTQRKGTIDASTSLPAGANLPVGASLPAGACEERLQSRAPTPGGEPGTPINVATSANVRVVCRLRPMSDREKKTGTVPAASASTERREVAVARVTAGGTRQTRSTFHFDDVLTSFSTQEDVFNATLAPLVGQVLAGYETTAFAYGQTGTGKTYTMEGDLENEEGRGLVPRTAAAVIDALSAGRYSEHAVTVSYLEIYNEELSDLLAPVAPMGQHQPKLDLKDVGGGRGVVCVGLSEVPVQTIGDILGLVRRAQERRRVAETRINARSSRSHSIFTMKVRCRKKVSGGELENVGKLHLVDLAGSECAKKGGLVEDKDLPIHQKQYSLTEEERERRSINQSLLTLGRVIASLRENSGRVPYRDSKLTRLLQDALGGRCKTVIIATISPALSVVEETVSTLTYAEQASGIRNRPVASSLLRTTRHGVAAEIRSEACAMTGICANDWAELEMKVTYLTQELEEAQGALARKYQEAQEVIDRAERSEAKLTQARADIRNMRTKMEEGEFIRQRMVQFAQHQDLVATGLSAAFHAASAHGQDLTAQLNQSYDRSAVSQKQARELCETIEKHIAVLSTAAKSKAEEVQGSATKVHQALGSVANIAEGMTQEQSGIFTDMLANLRENHTRAMDSLHNMALEADAALDAQQLETTTAMDAVTAASDAVSEAAERIKKELTERAISHKSRFAEESTAAYDAIVSKSETLRAMGEHLQYQITAAQVYSQEYAKKSLEAITEAGAVVQQMQASQATKVQDLLDKGLEGVQEMAEAAKSAAPAVSSHRQAAADSDASARSKWSSVQEDARTRLQAADSLVEDTIKKASLAMNTCNDNVAVEIQRGTKAKDHTLSALDSLVSGAMAALTEQQAAIRDGLAREPLRAFDMNEKQEAPSWPEAAHEPACQLLPYPDEEDLLSEFRESKENTVSPGPSPFPSPSPGKRAEDKTSALPGVDLTGGPRVALKELNQQD